MNQLRTLVDVWRGACADFAAVARSLSDTEWRLPTDLSGWSVGDVVAHCAALEAELAGDPPLRVEIDKSAAHIAGPRGIYTERGVVARRGRTPDHVIAEFEDAVERRTAMLAAEPLDDADAIPAITPGRSGWNWAILLRNRPIDIWVHEQDVRRAVGKPGDLDTVAAAHVQGVYGAALPYVVAKAAGAPPGTTVVFDVTGPLTGLYAVEVTEDHRGRPLAEVPDEPIIRFTLDTETFTMLGAGRRDPSNLPVRIIAGATAPEGLAARILTSLNVTP
ncbi:MAG: maleylpyruvate isomerase family mycothiol-dependent enzyme [Nocardioidaceae bacterium]